MTICDPTHDFNAKGESTRTTHFHFKTKEYNFISIAKSKFFPEMFTDEAVQRLS